MKFLTEKKYLANDMARLGCDDCSGCSACCSGMGNSIVLDPFDIYQLTKGSGKNFDELLTDALELNIVDGVILPNLRMAGKSEQCCFLNEQGRCGIHAFRPGICRLFPLGRIYEDDGFYYFLQIKECKKTNRTKLKISKWLGISDLKKYEVFVCEWHRFLKEMEAEMAGLPEEEKRKQIGIALLQIFYRSAYDPECDFYEQFQERMNRVRGKKKTESEK